MLIEQGLRADEEIALKLMQVLRAQADAACAPDRVEAVSVTFDLSAPPRVQDGLSFEARIDRKTRTVLFMAGSAGLQGETMMTATAVYRILPGG